MTVVRPGRVGCSSYRERGTCDNRNTETLASIETRVLEGIRNHLLHPDAIAEFVRAFHAEIRQAQRDRATREANAVRDLRDVEGRIARIVTAIEEGTDTEDMRIRLRDLDARRRTLRETVAGDGSAEMFTLHPGIAESYRRRIAELEEALRKNGPGRLEAMAAVRDMVDRIVLTPGAKRGELGIELHGRLAAALDLASGSQRPMESMLTLVAGARNHLYLLVSTIRLSPSYRRLRCYPNSRPVPPSSTRH